MSDPTPGRSLYERFRGSSVSDAARYFDMLNPADKRAWERLAGELEAEALTSHEAKETTSNRRMVRVRWIDSCMANEQVDDIDLPTPSELISVGWLSRETDDYLVITRDHSPAPNSYSWRGSLAIPRSQVLGLEDLKVVAALSSEEGRGEEDPDPVQA